MDKLLLHAVKATSEQPVVEWNDVGWPALVNQNFEFSRYMNNVPMPHHDGKPGHGYFALLHNIVSSLPQDAVICELGNREGLSTLAILDAMSKDQKFISIDIDKDLRFVPKEKANPLIVAGSFIALIGDCNHPAVIHHIEKYLQGKKIELLFCDTVHNYKQIKLEFETYKHLLADEAIILVDDIQNDHLHLPEGHRDRRTKYRFYEEWEGEKYDLTELCHNPTGFAAFIYRRKK